jgi:hypothetical protein
MATTLMTGTLNLPGSPTWSPSQRVQHSLLSIPDFKDRVLPALQQAEALEQQHVYTAEQVAQITRGLEQIAQQIEGARERIAQRLTGLETGIGGAGLPADPSLAGILGTGPLNFSALADRPVPRRHLTASPELTWWRVIALCSSPLPFLIIAGGCLSVHAELVEPVTFGNQAALFGINLVSIGLFVYGVRPLVDLEVSSA